MNFKGIKSKVVGLEAVGLKNTAAEYWNLTPAELVEETLKRGQGVLADNGALCVDTGEFTGRSPADKFTVLDDNTRDTVWWAKDGGKFNNPMSPETFDALYRRVTAFLQNRELFVRDLYAGADKNNRLNVRVVNVLPWANLFANNLFIRPNTEELENFTPEWTILCAPTFHAIPELDGTRKHNFSIIDFTRKIILIGGSAYTGEMKKGIFTVMNYVLPLKGVLSMHCSANVGKDGDTAIFFGLSGTGKTTLSADPERGLIGDDEHGWTDEGIFNFEGGCYAKCIDLTKEKEPQIWEAVKHGALVENTRFFPGTRTIDFTNTEVTENTRVAYPIHFIPGAVEPSVGGIPKNIFFLTCDAYGVLPPISKLSAGQAMYQFVSGYTAKVAGTELGVTEPQRTFSTCFGAPFFPLHPAQYAKLLGEKMTKHQTNVWLINTGWSGGPYGVGNRMKLSHTRAMITAALNGELNNVAYETEPTFGFSVPTSCPNVPAEVLNPRNTWSDKAAYDAKIAELANAFVKNFEQFKALATQEMLDAAPKVTA